MSTPGDGLDLALPRLSARVQAGAQHLQGGVNRLAHVGEPRIATLDLPSKAPPELSQIDADPGHMLTLDSSKAPRPLDRPDGVNDQLERVTAQFFLRNTVRLERFVDTDALEWEWSVLRTNDWQAELAEARACRHRDANGEAMPAPTGPINEHMAQRHSLMVDSRWSEQFGRPDPESD